MTITRIYSTLAPRPPDVLADSAARCFLSTENTITATAVAATTSTCWGQRPRQPTVAVAAQIPCGEKGGVMICLYTPTCLVSMGPSVAQRPPDHTVYCYVAKLTRLQQVGLNRDSTK